jgi:hypothetical protein
MLAPTYLWVPPFTKGDIECGIAVDVLITSDTKSSLKFRVAAVIKIEYTKTHPISMDGFIGI